MLAEAHISSLRSWRYYVVVEYSSEIWRRSRHERSLLRSRY